MDAVKGGAPGITPRVRARARASPRRSNGTLIRESPTRPRTTKAGHGPRSGLGYQFDATLGYPREGPSHSPFTRRGTKPSLRVWSTKRPERRVADPSRIRLDRLQTDCDGLKIGSRQQRYPTWTVVPLGTLAPIHRSLSRAVLRCRQLRLMRNLRFSSTNRRPVRSRRPPTRWLTSLPVRIRWSSHRYLDGSLSRNSLQYISIYKQVKNKQMSIKFW
jgi:hypothetical protein